MGSIGASEIFVVLLLIAIIFGAKRLPELGAGVGKAIRNFKEGMSGNDAIDVTPRKEEIAEKKEPQREKTPS